MSPRPGPACGTRKLLPEHLPQDVEVIARDAQKLVAAVDVAHILDEEGRVKPEWRARLTATSGTSPRS